MMSRDSKRVSRDEEFALLEKISEANAGAGVTYLEHLILQKRSQVYDMFSPCVTKSPY